MLFVRQLVRANGVSGGEVFGDRNRTEMAVRTVRPSHSELLRGRRGT